MFFFIKAQCWPNCIKCLGSWYPDSVRNSMFGMFGTCAFAGGIMGTSLAVSTLMMNLMYLSINYSLAKNIYYTSICVRRPLK